MSEKHLQTHNVALGINHAEAQPAVATLLGSGLFGGSRLLCLLLDLRLLVLGSGSGTTLGGVVVGLGLPVAQVVLGVVEHLAGLASVAVNRLGVTRDDGSVVEEM